MSHNYIELTRLCDSLDRELGDAYLDTLKQMDIVNVLKDELIDKELIICELNRQLKQSRCH